MGGMAGSGVMVTAGLMSTVALAVLSAGLSIGVLMLLGLGMSGRVVPKASAAPVDVRVGAGELDVPIDLRDKAAVPGASTDGTRRVVRLTLQRTQRSAAVTDRMSDLSS